MYRIVEQNLRTAMRCYSSVGNGSEARDYPGVTISCSGMDVPVFNSAMLTEPARDIRPMIQIADTHFTQRGFGWTFWLCEDMIAPETRGSFTRAAFRNAGMTRIAEPPGMYADRIKPASRPLAQLTFCAVDNERTRTEFAHIASIVFSLPFETSKKIYGSAGLWQPPSYGWIGYFDEKPVCVATTVIANGVVGVYSLGTLPQHQGCGYGETILRYAITEAQRETGIEPTVLQATPQGLRLYLRMGFRIVTKFSIYAREGCDSF